jgi:hypothetical protein
MKKIAAVLVGFSPLVVFAQASLDTLIDKFTYYLSFALPILVSVAVVWFVWQVIKYTISGEGDKRDEAKSGIIWGIVGLAVIVSIWGLVEFLTTTLGLDPVSAPDVSNLLPLN